MAVATAVVVALVAARNQILQRAVVVGPSLVIPVKRPIKMAAVTAVTIAATMAVTVVMVGSDGGRPSADAEGKDLIVGVGMSS